MIFLENCEHQKKRHRTSQQAYRLQHQEQIKKCNNKYFDNGKRKLDEINMEILKSNPIPTYLDVEEISRPMIVDKCTKKKARNRHSIWMLFHPIKQDKFHPSQEQTPSRIILIKQIQ
jgi:hypothetical protein